MFHVDGRFPMSVKLILVIELTTLVSTANPAEPVRSLPIPAGIASAAEAQATPDSSSVRRYGPAWRYPQAGWVVLHIEGAPYDRGYQHGRLMAAEIVDYIKTIATVRSHKAPGDAWRDLRMLTNALFLPRYDAEYLAEMKGIADGAAAAGAKFDDRRLDLIDIATINSDVEVGFLQLGLDARGTGIDTEKFSAPQFSTPKAKPHEHCSAFVATGPATADGKIVLGHITMSDLSYVQHFNVWLDVAPERGHRVVMQTFPGGIHSGLDYYINDAGLIVSETTIHQTKFDAQGEPLASRIRRAVQHADSIDKAVAILGERNNGLYTNQWLLGDTKTNEIAMFELGTHKTRLWRSSKEEWLADTRGFYWGCNKIRDVDVYEESVPDVSGKPANVVPHPGIRDRAWLSMYSASRGKIDEAFAFTAFTTPPLAAFPSCDAKFTTAALAKELKSWALFGPPLGRTWDPSPEDRKKNPDVQPLVSNDWTLLTVTPPASVEPPALAADILPFPEAEKNLGVKFDAAHPFVWRGTLRAETDGDLWLAAAFAEYEKVIALEQALTRESKDGVLSPRARDLVDLALFQHESKWLAAVRRLGRDIPLVDVRTDPAEREWYDVACGKGVLLLAALRERLGGEAFDRAMDDFGRAHAGRKVSTAEFVGHLEQAAGKKSAQIFEDWLRGDVLGARPPRDIWTIYSFEAEPTEQALIVYGTLGDRAAQREAAELLQREIARRFSNSSIPIRADTDVTDADLQSHHLLLVGRPATNRVTARSAEKLPVAFGPGSFAVRGETYADAESAVIVAGDNPHNARYSVVVAAGNSARSTWHCVQQLDTDEDPAPQVFLFPARQLPRKLRVAPPSAVVAQP